MQLATQTQDQPLKKSHARAAPLVNRPKVYKSIFWFGVSIFGYTMMEKYNQGLELQSSQEMFCFSACETLFLLSMAMSYFYSWQTYSFDETEVVAVDMRDVMKHSKIIAKYYWRRMCMSKVCSGL